MKFYRYYIVGFVSLVFELLAVYAVGVGELKDAFYLGFFGLLLIPIGFMVERLELKIEKISAG